MTVLVNGRFLAQPVTGVQRFAREISRGAHRQGVWSPEDYAVPTPAQVGDGAEFEPTRLGRRTGHAWEQLELGRSRMLDDRMLVNLCNTAPIYRRRQLVVLHDVAFVARPGNFTWRFRAWYRAMVRSYMAAGVRIATVSEFSRQEIARCFGYPIERIGVVPESGEHILEVPADRSVLDAAGVGDQPFVLAVSSRVPNKNFASIARAAAMPELAGVPFLIAGGAGAAGVFDGGAIQSPHTRFLGYVSDAQLRALYERAAVFVFPSFYEGFGLPVLEAMSCGCPVIASDTSSIPEVAGEAAMLIDPNDPAMLARAIATVIGDPDLRRRMREAGLAQARRFTWDRAAARLGELIGA